MGSEKERLEREKLEVEMELILLNPESIWRNYITMQ